MVQAFPCLATGSLQILEMVDFGAKIQNFSHVQGK